MQGAHVTSLYAHKAGWYARGDDVIEYYRSANETPQNNRRTVLINVKLSQCLKREIQAQNSASRFAHKVAVITKAEVSTFCVTGIQEVRER